MKQYFPTEDTQTRIANALEALASKSFLITVQSENENENGNTNTGNNSENSNNEWLTSIKVNDNTYELKPLNQYPTYIRCQPNSAWSTITMPIKEKVCFKLPVTADVRYGLSIQLGFDLFSIYANNLYGYGVLLLRDKIFCGMLPSDVKVTNNNIVYGDSWRNTIVRENIEYIYFCIDASSNTICIFKNNITQENLLYSCINVPDRGMTFCTGIGFLGLGQAHYIDSGKLATEIILYNSKNSLDFSSESNLFIIPDVNPFTYIPNMATEVRWPNGTTTSEPCLLTDANNNKAYKQQFLSEPLTLPIILRIKANEGFYYFHPDTTVINNEWSHGRDFLLSTFADLRVEIYENTDTPVFSTSLITYNPVLWVYINPNKQILKIYKGTPSNDTLIYSNYTIPKNGRLLPRMDSDVGETIAQGWKTSDSDFVVFPNYYLANFDETEE